MPYSAKAIANYFLERAGRDEQKLSPMKLQKLVYFAQGWHLAVRGKSLINEQVEAWRYGPVVRSLYQEFRNCGDQSIDHMATTWVDDGEECGFVIPLIEDIPEDAEFTAKFLDRVWDLYGGYSAIQLSNLTHEPGTPWDTISKAYDGAIPLGTDIPQEVIRDYFRGQMRREVASA